MWLGFALLCLALTSNLAVSAEKSAFMLRKNRIVGEADEMNAKTLPKVKRPNRDGFVANSRPDMKPKY